MSEIKLLPCPFCGGSAQRITLNEENEVFKDSSFYNGDTIQCTKCFCSTKVFFGEKQGIYEAWNNRYDTAKCTCGKFFFCVDNEHCDKKQEIPDISFVNKGWYSEDEIESALLDFVPKSVAESVVQSLKFNH